VALRRFLGGGMSGFDSAATVFEQSPALGQFFAAHESGGDEVEAFAADSLLRLEAEGFGAVREEISAGNFALDQHGMAGALPADGIGHLTADAGLFGEHYAAAVAAQPVDGFFD
jgi:hypothetical protein